jgi:hypothetical protein
MTGSCPSRIAAHVYDYGVEVEFVSTHVGHTFTTQHLNHSKTTTEWAASMMMMHVSKHEIIQQAREYVTDDAKKSTLSIQDLTNIEKSRNIRKKRHENDAVSIESWINEMKELGDDCPVRYFKQQGWPGDKVLCAPVGLLAGNGTLRIESPHPHESDFVLIIMTNGQAEMLKTYGNDVITTDSTHGSNAYDFQLTTIMVLDENRSGFASAYMFSSRIDTDAMTLFFSVIKELTGDLKCRSFMTDDANAYYNAWCKVMSPPENKLLCTWHVIRNWNKKILTVNQEFRDHIRNSLHKIMKEIDEVTMEREAAAFVQFLGETVMHPFIL